MELKVKKPLSTSRRHAGSVEVELHSFLTSTPDGDEWPIAISPVSIEQCGSG